VSFTSDRFRIAPPDPSGAIVTTIGYETERERPGDHRGLPSPFLTFIVTLDEPVVLVDEGAERQLDVVLAGLHTEPETVRMPRRQSGLQAAVHPLATRRLFGMPAAELVKCSLDGQEVLGSASARLRERLAESPTWPERFEVFAEEARTLAPRRSSRWPRPEVVEAWRLLWASRGQIRIGDLAQRVFLSRRRLSTLFAQELGCSPKELARTMRFSHAIARIGKGVRARQLDLAATAAECGFADQSHLVRDFHRFAGTSPSAWIAEEFPNIQAGGHRYAREWEA
jgi:AraC-like DNA-binding protein